MTEIITWYGALIELFLAIFLILKGINSIYSLFFGVIIGAFIGGANLIQTVSVLTSGTQSIMGTVSHVLAIGILVGVMMESGAAETIAQALIKKLGEKKALLLALSDVGKLVILSLNPNTITAANGFDLSSSDVMISGLIPAVFGLIATVVIPSTEIVMPIPTLNKFNRWELNEHKNKLEKLVDYIKSSSQFLVRISLGNYFFQEG